MKMCYAQVITEAGERTGGVYVTILSFHILKFSVINFSNAPWVFVPTTTETLALGGSSPHAETCMLLFVHKDSILRAQVPPMMLTSSLTAVCAGRRAKPGSQASSPLDLLITLCSSDCGL